MSDGRCPHCRTNVGATRAKSGGYRCKLCGGPRVVADDGKLTLSGNEVPLLKEARSSSHARWLWLLGSVLSGFAAAGGLAFALLANWLFEPSNIGSALLIAGGLLPLFFTVFAASRSRRAAKSSSEALRHARLGAVRDALQDGRELSESDVGQLLALPPAESEALLAELNLDDSVMSTVTDAGDVTYRSANLRLRIEEAARAAGIPSTLEGDSEVAIGDSRDQETTKSTSSRGTEHGR